MKGSQLFILFLAISISLGCVSNLEFDEQIGKSSLVIFSKFNTDSLTVELTTSLPSDIIYFQVPDLQNADVVIQDESGYNWNLGFKRKLDNTYHFSNDDLFPKISKHYYLKIAQPEYAIIEAESFIPPKPQPMNYQVSILREDSIFSGINKLKRTQFRFKFDLKSVSNDDGYYGLQLIARISDTITTIPLNVLEYTLHLNTNNLESEELIYNQVAQNIQFEWDKSDNPEGRFEMDAEILFPNFNNSYNQKIKAFEVVLEAQTEDLFLFYQQARLQNILAAPNVPIFSEPVILHTNIENGLGYFSGSNTTKDTIPLP